jgi:hypothetical protein
MKVKKRMEVKKRRILKNKVEVGNQDEEMMPYN